MKIVRPAKLRGESDRLNDMCRKRAAFLVNSGRGLVWTGNVAIGDILFRHPYDEQEAPEHGRTRALEAVLALRFRGFENRSVLCFAAQNHQLNRERQQQEHAESVQHQPASETSPAMLSLRFRFIRHDNKEEHCYAVYSLDTDDPVSAFRSYTKLSLVNLQSANSAAANT